MNLTPETASSKIVTPNKMQIAAEVTTSAINFNSAQQKPLPLEMNKVGQSVFYGCLDLSPMAEKQDDMKPEQSDTEEESKHLILGLLTEPEIQIDVSADTAIRIAFLEFT